MNLEDVAVIDRIREDRVSKEILTGMLNLVLSVRDDILCHLSIDQPDDFCIESETFLLLCKRYSMLLDMAQEYACQLADESDQAGTIVGFFMAQTADANGCTKELPF